MKLINSANFTAVLDTNVLFPVVIRDYLLWLAAYRIYSPKWSEKILDEFYRLCIKKGLDIPQGRIKKQIEMWNRACQFALVEDYEHLIPSINLPDENDNHVAAVAIKSNADVIVTFNLGDFPEDKIGNDIIVQVPDVFIADMIDLEPKKCCDAFRQMVLTKNRPPYDENQYLDIMRKNKLGMTCDELEKHL